MVAAADGGLQLQEDVSSGPLALTNQQREEEEVEEVTFLQDRVSTQTIEFSRLNNFFMNPNKVARNMFVCTSLVGNFKSHKSPGNFS